MPQSWHMGGPSASPQDPTGCHPIGLFRILSASREKSLEGHELHLVPKPSSTEVEDRATRPPALARVDPDDIEKLPMRLRNLYQIRLETEPVRTIPQCARMLGIKPGTAQTYWTEIKKCLGKNPVAGRKTASNAKTQAQLEQERELALMKAVAPKTMAELLNQKARILLEHITDKRAAQATVSELARAAQNLIQSRNLILGEPTQILRVEDRRHLHELLPAMLEEARQRGWVASEGGQLERPAGMWPQKRIKEPIDVNALPEKT